MFWMCVGVVVRMLSWLWKSEFLCLLVLMMSGIGCVDLFVKVWIGCCGRKLLLMVGYSVIVLGM